MTHPPFSGIIRLSSAENKACGRHQTSEMKMRAHSTYRGPAASIALSVRIEQRAADSKKEDTYGSIPKGPPQVTKLHGEYTNKRNLLTRHTKS
jgi:hypothetical protein